MIDNEKYREVLDSGLLLDHYFVLLNIKNGVKLTESKRVLGFINLLTKKEYLTDEQELTEKGLQLISGEEIPQPRSSLLDRVNNRIQTQLLADFAMWASGLHERLQAKLMELTGKKQVIAKIDKKSYSFLPNTTDLGKVLRKTMTVYKIDDRAKIEDTIMKYIDKCYQANNWFPLLMYYINKNGVSNLVTDMENPDETDEGYKSSQKFV